jgi:hypothetical protein
MSQMTRIPPATLLLFLIFFAGCHNAGTIPPGWHGEPVSQANDQQTQPANTTTSQHNTNTPPAQLQIFICYGKVLSNHTALRLTTPHKPTLMWDPGGTFLQYDPTRARRHDVITQNAPTIDQWWQYRRDGCREPIMELFQWSITPDQANRLHAILLNHRDPNDPTQSFEPDAGGLQCSTKVSEFLIRFANDKPTITQKQFWPHKLAEQLWTQNPDSVTVFRSDGNNQVYRRYSKPVSPE